MRKGGTYVAMGDSWTWANQNTVIYGRHFYNTQIRDYIRNNYGACRLINKGLGGATSATMVSNIPYLFDLQYDLITIGVGMNDCNNQGVSLANYQSNLNTLIDTSKRFNPNAHIILCTPGQTNTANRTPYIQGYRDAMASVASSRGVDVCHFENAWTSAQIATYNESDGLHPNVNGHPLLYNQLLPIVQTGTWLKQLTKS